MPLPSGSTNFADVEKFADFGDLAIGDTIKVEGHIESVRFREAADSSKSDQLSVTLESDEEDTKGARGWQNLYFSKKALYRMAEFFDIFGISEIDWEQGLSSEEPFDLLDPDLSGEPVVFTVYRDDDYRGKPSYKCEVVEWLGKAAAPKAEAKADKPAPRRPSEGSARRTLR